MRISERRTADDGIVSLHTDVSALHEVADVQRKARGIAEQATQAKAEFLATMSHELRTPMNGVIGMTSLLLETELTAEQREFAETVRQCGDSLLSLINEILDFSKIEAGQLIIEHIPFNPRRLAEESIALFANQAQEKGLEIICEVSADIPKKVFGDPTRLRQVIVNLVGNAIKFTERGEVVLSLLREPSENDQVPISIIIRDTGIGISSDDRQRLFKPFSQADSTTTRKYGGTGLGLVICQRIVTLMGGEIKLHSEVGMGSTFSCHITFKEAHDSEASLFTQDLIGRHVIIAAGHSTARRVLRDQLLAWGMTCDEASCESEIQSCIKFKRPALIVIDNDIQNGALVVGQTVHAQQGQIPLVLLTGAAHRGMAASAQAVGFTGFLTKPIRQAQLFDCLQLVFEQSCRVTEQKELVKTTLITRHTLAEDVSPRRVLVVEDNAVNRQVVVMMLGKLGCHCDIATNGKEAVEALAKQSYQIVFMDCQMPIMDGFEATRIIRQSEMGQRQTRIVALTANAMVSDREKCLAVGMDGYLSKPVKMTELADVLKFSAQAPKLPIEHSEEKSQPQHAEIDDDVLVRLREATDRETVRTVIGILRSELPNITEELELAIARHDTVGLARLAHRLKGTTGSLGLMRLQIISQEMETAARANLLARAANLGRNMLKTFQEVIPLLENHPVVTRATT